MKYRVYHDEELIFEGNLQEFFDQHVPDVFKGGSLTQMFFQTVMMYDWTWESIN